MGHAMWPDWSMGRVHVTGAILLVTLGEGWHDQDVLGTCTRRECLLIVTG